MWLMLQRETPEDYVIATGETHSVRELVELAFSEINMEIKLVQLFATDHIYAYQCVLHLIQLVNGWLIKGAACS